MTSCTRTTPKPTEGMDRQPLLARDIGPRLARLRRDLHPAVLARQQRKTGTLIRRH
jgi:hypothetical protein